MLLGSDDDPGKLAVSMYYVLTVMPAGRHPGAMGSLDALLDGPVAARGRRLANPLEDLAEAS